VNPVGITAMVMILLVLIFLYSGGGSSSGVKLQKDGVIQLRQLLTVAIAAAKQGGLEVKAVREEADLGESSKGKTLEGANDPKTNGDMRSHIQMMYGIKKVFPDLNIISEEHGETEVDLAKIPDLSQEVNSEVDDLVKVEGRVPLGDIAVWIDPLDATQEYTEKLLNFVTTMVCVAVSGKPVLGVIHKPFSDETAWAWAGDVNVVSPSLKVAKEGSSDLTAARIIVSRSHAGEVNSTAQTALGTGIKVTPAGGAGFKTWEVVTGDQDAYVHTTRIKKWDICAGDAILRAAGGKLTNLQGTLIDYAEAEEAVVDGGLLATMFNHETFLEKLRTLKP